MALPKVDGSPTSGKPSNSELSSMAQVAPAEEPQIQHAIESKGTAVPAVHPPPDGGFWAWMQVAASFSIFFNTWGVLNTFGIFQTYYERGELFHETSSNISWIGTIQAYCVMLIGLISGPIYDRGYLRALLFIGSFLVVFGFMMLSICNEFWQTILAQGFCIGIGQGLLFVPSLAILPTYFKTRLGLAVGIAASGSSLGGVIYPIVFYKLIDQIGFGWTVRVLGFMALATQVVPLCFARMRIKPAVARAVIDWSAFSDLPYILFVIITTIGFIGLYAVLFYISYFAGATNLASSKMSFYLIPILNAASVFGRIVPNAISDKTGPFNLFGFATIACGVLTFCILAVSNLGGIVTITALYGFFSGVFVAIPGVCFAQLTENKSKLGTRIGMGFAGFAFGVLAGGPGGGAILGANKSDLDWTALWLYAGCTTICCGVLQVVFRFWLSKGKLIVKI